MRFDISPRQPIDSSDDILLIQRVFNPNNIDLRVAQNLLRQNFEDVRR